jgi:uncharacterized protein
MQTIAPEISASAQMIQSYGPAGFRIAGIDYAGSVLVTPTSTTLVDLHTLEDITLDSFNALFAITPPLEVLLVGTGAKHDMLEKDLRLALKAKGLPADAMNTGAAARTFNILLAEERRVAALLLLP